MTDMTAEERALDLMETFLSDYEKTNRDMGVAVRWLGENIRKHFGQAEASAEQRGAERERERIEAEVEKVLNVPVVEVKPVEQLCQSHVNENG